MYLLQTLVDVVVNVVISYHHYSPVGGHIDIFKTKTKVRERFFYLSLNKDAIHKVHACFDCATNKPSQNTKLGLESFVIPNCSMKKIHVNFMDKLPIAKKSNILILFTVDHFSHVTWFCPFRETNTVNIIKALS